MAIAESVLNVRIALVTTQYITEPFFAGGVANYTYRVAQGLRKLGQEPEVFVHSSSQESIRHDGITVHRFRVYNPIYIRVLTHMLRRLRCESWAAYIDSLKYIWSVRTRVYFRYWECPFVVVI
jgi:hypothetical protein